MAHSGDIESVKLAKQQFPIPEGFITSKLSISLNSDGKMGSLPWMSDDKKMTFVLKKTNLLRYFMITAESNVINKISMASDYTFELVFVSPPICVPDGWFDESKLDDYLAQMVKKWNRLKQENEDRISKRSDEYRKRRPVMMSSDEYFDKIWWETCRGVFFSFFK
jgi:hypothetical protein